MNTYRFALRTFTIFTVALLMTFAGLLCPFSNSAAASTGSSDSMPEDRPIDVSASSNWAGYSMTGSDFTAVQGSWVVPDISKETAVPLAGDAAWIGIGGITHNDLIQIGTEDFADGKGNRTYQAFYETLPNAAKNINMSINSGDSISASINEVSEGKWLLTLKDRTTGDEFSKEVDYDSSKSSAEWIEEMPLEATSDRFVPLDDFGSVTFSGISTTKDGVSIDLDQNAESITLLHGNSALAVPSKISDDGSSFTVNRTDVPLSAELAENNIQTFRVKRGNRMVTSSQTLEDDGSWQIVRIFIWR